MKLYSIVFTIQHLSGQRVSNDAMVITQKIRGRSAYAIKWDWARLNSYKNKAEVFEGADEREAIQNFISKHIDWCDVRLEMMSKICMNDYR